MDYRAELEGKNRSQTLADTTLFANIVLLTVINDRLPASHTKSLLDQSVNFSYFLMGDRARSQSEAIWDEVDSVEESISVLP